MSSLPNPEDHRKADHPIERLFIRRWSPYSLSGQPLTDQQVATLFEAARWAPSTYNEQEWRFLYARRDTSHWPLFFDLLVEGNKQWCSKAALLAVVIARKTFTRNGKPNVVHLYDAGSAWENLALQAASMGLIAHGMAGFDFEKARSTLRVPDHFAVAAMFAVGHPGPDDPSDPDVPSGRRPIAESICEGPFASPPLAG